MSANTAVAITTGMVREGENAVVASRAVVRRTTSTHRMLIHNFVFLICQPRWFLLDDSPESPRSKGGSDAERRHGQFGGTLTHSIGGVVTCGPRRPNLGV